MAKLTASQVSAQLGVTAYTIKRWYNWYENENVNRLNELAKQGMPGLPKYDTVGSMGWRYWEETDIEQLRAFKKWMPHTKNGIMGKKKEDK